MTTALALSPSLLDQRSRATFPSSDLVDAAAGMFTGHRVAERRLGVTLNGDVMGAALAKSRELFPDRFTGARHQSDHELVEGPRSYIVVSPGSVAVRRTDPVRAERTHERQVLDALAWHRLAQVDDEPRGAAGVTSWSAKSRSRMVETIAQLDLAPALADGGTPVALTLTYPGPWLDVAPDAQVCRRHVDAFRARWRRHFGGTMVGIWKREFQRRGAPHYHIWTVLPAGVTVTQVRRWLGATWASVVGTEHDPDCSSRTNAVAPAPAPAGPQLSMPNNCDRCLHILAGTAVDTVGTWRDPRRLGVYFAKHNSFSAKDYQNHAPEEWVESGSVGRFWGVWGLRKAVAAVEVHGDDAIAAERVLRRHSRANSYVARQPYWRYRTLVDVESGEVTARWRKSTRKTRVYRHLAGGGYVVANDGPALAAGVARALDIRRQTAPARRAGAGPVGFLP